MVGIQAPLDWLIGEIFWAGKAGEDPSEASPNFTRQPEAQPGPPGPAAEVDRHIGVSSACVRVCVRGGERAVVVCWGSHSCMRGVERFSLGLPETFQASPPPQISPPLFVLRTALGPQAGVRWDLGPPFLAAGCDPRAHRSN